jgi:chromosome segregation ATPase
MKQLLIRLLGLVGLVTTARYQTLKAQLRDLESRTKKLAKLVDESRAEAKEWRAKATEASKQSTSMERQASHQSARVEKLMIECGKLREDVKRARATQHELESLRARLVNAERELSGSREHLMAIEVKLDILEGAANVLDSRTRSVIAQRDRETGIPV